MARCGENISRLHHGQSTPNALHWHDQRFAPASLFPQKKLMPGFTKRYGIDRLVYYEEHLDALSAIRRQKEIKGWKREKKIALIELMNPTWEDLKLG